MGEKAEEFLAKARELEERAQNVNDLTARSVLLEVARRWRRLAREVERDELDKPAKIPPTKPEGGP
jgi:hypothetical protein